MREGRRKGAAVFVNLTNDNWYPSSRLTQQHFYHGRLRAVENGIPLLRACNTGITAAVDPFGRSIATLGLGEGAGILSTKVNLTEHQTLYTFWGDAGILGLSILFLGLNISLIRKKPCSK
jgi:apolipoprotein N-acyltransferase